VLPSGSILSLLLLAMAFGIAGQLFQILLGKTVMSVERPSMYDFEPFNSRIVAFRRLGCTGCALTAGGLACLQGGFSILGLGTRVVMSIYALGAGAWFLNCMVTLSLGDLMRANATPLLWFICLLVFAGARQEVWSRLPALAGLVAWGLAPLMLYSMQGVKHYGRFEGNSPQLMYLSLGVWFAQYYLLATQGTSWVTHQ